jgi:hypothetical protein
VVLLEHVDFEQLKKRKPDGVALKKVKEADQWERWVAVNSQVDGEGALPWEGQDKSVAKRPRTITTSAVAETMVEEGDGSKWEALANRLYSIAVESVVVKA